jgi:FkbM family methyltransferase
MIFLDCGGHDGSSVRKFRQTRDSECEIVTFEPNPLYAQCYQGFERHRLIAAAVWTEDGARDFYLDRIDGDGSSLLRDKRTGDLDRERPIRVATVDLPEWIRLNATNIILKLDIEGAEYAVLDKMLADGTARHVRELLIEWHWAKVGISEATHRDMVERWEATGIPVSYWDAGGW